MNKRAQMDVLVARLEKLTPETPPRWGKMTAQHMVEHLAIMTTLSNGKRTVSIQTPPEKLASRMAFLYSDAAFPRDFIPGGGSGELLPLRFGNIPAALEALRKQLRDMDAWFQANPDSEQNHPIFGALKAEDWYTFHLKHLTHHLTQFGLLDT